ncbi:ATP synthase F1 subunit epsilon [Roseivirga sp. BDSF3-8]|uniref:ATP synthase F1 subunit epsilon n=1 Tax=Roseivirga sp. BDSF3-8 TaxID=3241598 RepID=UPI003531ADCD
MLLEIITPDKKVFQGEVSSATFPGSEGSFQVLMNHAPLISSLTKGPIVYDATGSGRAEVTIDGGIVEVLDNKIIVLAEKVIDAEA